MLDACRHQDDHPDVYTPAEVARRLGVSVRTIQRFCKTGILPVIGDTSGRHAYRIPRRAFELLLEYGQAWDRDAARLQAERQEGRADLPA